MERKKPDEQRLSQVKKSASTVISHVNTTNFDVMRWKQQSSSMGFLTKTHKPMRKTLNKSPIRCLINTFQNCYEHQKQEKWKKFTSERNLKRHDSEMLCDILHMILEKKKDNRLKTMEI